MKRSLWGLMVILLAFTLPLGGCRVKTHQLTVYWQQSSRSTASATRTRDGNGIAVTGPIFLTASDRIIENLETTVTDANGNVVTTGTVTYTTDAPDTLGFRVLDSRSVICNVQNFGVRWAKVYATYTDEGIEPVVREMDFALAHTGHISTVGGGFDFDTDAEVAGDSSEADLIVANYIPEYQHQLRFPYGYKIIENDPGQEWMEYLFTRYNTYPVTGELTRIDYATERMDLDMERRLFVMQTSAGRYFKVIIQACGGGMGNFSFCYIELLPSKS